MTEPTRDAQVLHLLKILPTQFGHYGDQLTAAEGELLAYAAECVKRVPELEAEVERLRAKAELQRDQLVEGLLDVWGQFSHPMGDGWAHDGGLSTLAWVAEDLVRLGAFEQHPKRDWFRPYAAATREGTDA